MNYYKQQRQMRAAQARYDAMEPPEYYERELPEPEDVDERYHKYVDGELKLDVDAWLQHCIDERNDAIEELGLSAVRRIEREHRTRFGA